MKHTSAPSVLHPQSRKKRGRPPGSLIYVGKLRQRPIALNVIAYNQDQIQKTVIHSLDELSNISTEGHNLWLNTDGIHDPAIIEAIGKKFNIYPLVLEDILNTNSRPKVDDYDEYSFIILKMLSLPSQASAGNQAAQSWQASDLKVEQISMVLGRNFLLTFQEDEYDLFDGIRSRLDHADSRLRKRSIDFLAYSLIDRIVDEYFVVLEDIGERIENLEDQLTRLHNAHFVTTHSALKRQTLLLRRAVWPLREVVSALLRNERQLIRPETLPYLRDVYDHIIQVIDVVELYRDLLGDLKDVYLSSLSLHLNQVMKVLTIIATLFIPLTFIVGVYGMNFRYMPELEWRYGYLIVWLVIIAVATSLLWYFRKMRWI
ncbi:MAG: magnesium/cobalt transporter CorA [Chitinophagales bacterium]|nr:magnesium/cobalt transporter CorA [Chitinophagales bacterium]MDW8427849.1 magnesium/cobalt transporter CorA [Chitinophagales bacterium]